MGGQANVAKAAQNNPLQVNPNVDNELLIRLTTWFEFPENHVKCIRKLDQYPLLLRQVQKAGSACHISFIMEAI
jgi:hypothetical protein